MTSAGTADDDVVLLRMHEPVLRLTAGELFLPCSVDDYVEGAALYRRTHHGHSELLADHGELDLARLAVLGRDHLGQDLWLRGVVSPLDRRAYKAWRREPSRTPFRASSRFAAVGLLSRLIDSFLRLTLLLRGKVPGGYTAAAHALQQRVLDAPGGSAKAPVYYGRVVRADGWISLQYWFFYRMNDWRSTFGGVNDHEADWEQITVVLAEEQPGSTRPAWVAFSSHDETGADLRRRWDDPDLEVVDGTHPVVYVGAGSHSGAYLPGEYLVSVPLPLPGPIESVRKALLRVLPWSDPEAHGVSVPYLDYRRGDGPALGPGGLEWKPILIDDEVPWVRDYRGLWGLDTRDPLGGERAPAGPRYDRDGSVRTSWRRPASWAGLDTESSAPDTAAAARLTLVGALEDERGRLRAEIETRTELARAVREAERSAGIPLTKSGPEALALAGELASLRRRDDRITQQLEDLSSIPGEPRPEGPHDHLRHRALPVEQSTGGRGRALRVWSAMSASLLLFLAGLIFLRGDQDLLGPLVLLAVLAVVVEAVLRRRLMALVVGVAVTTGVLVLGWAAVQLVAGNVRAGIGILLVAAAAYMAWQTIKEGLLSR